MTLFVKIWLSVLVLLILAASGPLAANEIYHWIDADGVNHYSQSPPPPASGEVRTLEVDGAQPASYDPNEDRYNVAAQAEATQAFRDKLAENRKNREKEPVNTAENTVIYYPEPDSGNAFLYPPDYRPQPPNRPPRPRPGRPDGDPDQPEPEPEVTPPASKPFRPRGN